nr:hypothetical protein CFP56_53278 [Quercus suber]
MAFQRKSGICFLAFGIYASASIPRAFCFSDFRSWTWLCSVDFVFKSARFVPKIPNKNWGWASQDCLASANRDSTRPLTRRTMTTQSIQRSKGEKVRTGDCGNEVVLSVTPYVDKDEIKVDLKQKKNESSSYPIKKFVVLRHGFKLSLDP